MTVHQGWMPVQWYRTGVLPEDERTVMKISTMKIVRSLAALTIMILAAMVPLHAQFAFDECSNTTAWVPAGIDLPGRGLHAVTMNDELYIIHRIVDSDSTSIALSKWDGTSLTTLSTFTCKRAIAHAVVYQGSIYISGMFTSVNDIAGTGGLARWDGTGWSAVAANPFYIPVGRAWTLQWDQIFAMRVYKDELIVSGAFLDNNNGEFEGIFGWNGATWRKIAETPRASNDSLQVTAFAEWRGDLYVGGYFSRIGGVEAHGVARWDGTTWSSLGNDTENLRRVLALIVYQDRLYAIGNIDNTTYGLDWGRDSLDEIARWDGVGWKRISKVLPKDRSDLRTRVRAVVHNDELYIMVQRYIHGVLGRRFDGSRGEAIAQPNDEVNFMIEYRGNLYVGGSFTSSCGLSLGHFAKLCTPLDCFGISGQVRNDPSGDCADSLASGGLAGRIVQLVPGKRYAVTDSNGYYRIYAPVGSYRLGLHPVRHWNQLCPSNAAGWDLEVTTPVGSVRKNFATAAIPHQYDLAVSVMGGRLRRSLSANYDIECSNPGTATISAATVRFEFDPRLEGDSSSMTWTSTAPSRAGRGWMEWDVTGLQPAQSRSFKVKFGSLWGIDPGTTVCATAAVVLSGDVVPEDNRDTLCTLVVDSYDPNDMAVSPAGPGNNGHISMTDSMLTYMVRFQNTGTDTAFRVVVVDTLSPNLDLTSLRLGASSHPFTLKIREGGALVFIFDDIDLPHQKVSDDKSQGYFRFSIGMYERPRPNTQIPNRAHIYFDYNDPITTNTVVSTVVESPVSSVASGGKGGGVKVFPNPAHGAVYLRGAIVPGSVVEVRNMLGELVMSSRYEPPGDAGIDLENLPAGNYLLNVQTPAGREAHTITLVR